MASRLGEQSHELATLWVEAACADEVRVPLGSVARAGVVRVDEARAGEAPAAAGVPEVRPLPVVDDVRAAVARTDEARLGVVRVDEVLAGVVLAEVRAAAVGAVPEARPGEVCDEARTPLAPRAIEPRAIATRARLGARRNPRTIRWVKVSALLSASVQKR